MPGKKKTNIGVMVNWAMIAKLGSIAVHADEMLSPGGHALDRTVLTSLLEDTEVRRFLVTHRALFPVKRRKS